MYTLYKFHFLNGISEINQLFDDILIIWPAPVYIYMKKYFYTTSYSSKKSSTGRFECANKQIIWNKNSTCLFKVYIFMYFIILQLHNLININT